MCTLGLTKKITQGQKSCVLPWTEESNTRMRVTTRTSLLHWRSTCIVTSSLQFHHQHSNPQLGNVAGCSLSLLERVPKPQTLPRTHVTISWTNRKRSTSKPRKIKQQQKKNTRQQNNYSYPIWNCITIPSSGFSKALLFATWKFSPLNGRSSLQHSLFFTSSGNNLNRRLLTLRVHTLLMR